MIRSGISDNASLHGWLPHGLWLRLRFILLLLLLLLLWWLLLLLLLWLGLRDLGLRLR